MLMVVLASLAATVAVSHAEVEVQREREAQLLWVGDQFRRALQSYHAITPTGGVPQYPRKLSDLLEDKRFPNPVRHLRQVYVDPVTGRPDWVLEMLQDQIVGLHSVSKRAPLRHAGFTALDAGFADAQSYAQWRFLATDAAGTAAAPAAAPGSSAAPGANPANPVGASGNGPAVVAPPRGGARNAADQGSSATTPAPAAAPAAPPADDSDPTLSSRCLIEFVFPRSQCNAEPPPLGTDENSCLAQYTQLYDRCIAGG